ncbi:GNAT family N-acetyltransferase [Microbispora cellulosiformans]|uniref:GNAT family N-acetyltransferase n=1 Tax=Microbispora cellulosiformans TaxID=2614688 RepID=A0A5J5JTQ2_9ACTN|nr:GNAT family N-acetyltransferase [Microbispora cellulosiformans]KAA9374555.1 GNAT family N-acetyltransferase [Microbispora cellulosiformans]
MSAGHPLDNPVWASLTGPHAHLAERHGNALRYPVDVSPFHTLPDDPGPGDWHDLAVLAGPGATIPVTGVTPPDGWEVVAHGAGVQLVGDDVVPAWDDEAVRLGAADVPDVLDLVERTQPGPFRPRTIELGVYLGIRRRGALVAMAGERLHPPGWTEISAVCTDPAFRRQGLAARLVLAVAAGVRARGEIPFLHAAESNVDAIRLYETLGFRLRRRTTFTAVRVPADVPVA